MKQELFGFKGPSKACTDKKCPYHGLINVKEEILHCKVIKKDVNHSATIEWFRSFYVPKYERYEVRRSRLKVHNPECIDAQIGEKVVVAKSRPLSKTKNHIIIGRQHESS